MCMWLSTRPLRAGYHKAVCVHEIHPCRGIANRAGDVCCGCCGCWLAKISLSGVHKNTALRCVLHHMSGQKRFLCTNDYFSPLVVFQNIPGKHSYVHTRCTRVAVYRLQLFNATTSRVNAHLPINFNSRYAVHRANAVYFA